MSVTAPSPTIRQVVTHLADLIGRGDYVQAAKLVDGTVSAAEMEAVIDGEGYRLSKAPSWAQMLVRVQRLPDLSGWHVICPLWNELGPSELHLEMELYSSETGFLIELHDIIAFEHVLAA